jgi:hypothetical protein
MVCRITSSFGSGQFSTYRVRRRSRVQADDQARKRAVNVVDLAQHRMAKGVQEMYRSSAAIRFMLIDFDYADLVVVSQVAGQLRNEADAAVMEDEHEGDGDRPDGAAAGHGIAAHLLVELHRLPAAERRAIAREALAELDLHHRTTTPPGPSSPSAATGSRSPC